MDSEIDTSSTPPPPPPPRLPRLPRLPRPLPRPTIQQAQGGARPGARPTPIPLSCDRGRKTLLLYYPRNITSPTTQARAATSFYKEAHRIDPATR